jgi:hypothetical protein
MNKIEQATAAAVKHLVESRREMVGEYPASEIPVPAPVSAYTPRPLALDHLTALRDANPTVQKARAYQAALRAEAAGEAV